VKAPGLLGVGCTVANLPLSKPQLGHQSDDVDGDNSNKDTDVVLNTRSRKYPELVYNMRSSAVLTNARLVTSRKFLSRTTGLKARTRKHPGLELCCDRRQSI